MRIELYSVRGFTGKALREKLQYALREHHIDSEIIEIHSIDQFVMAGLPSVPAIRFGDKVFLHLPSATLEQTVDQVLDFILHAEYPDHHSKQKP